MRCSISCKKRQRTKTRENTYIIPVMSRTPRQIVSFGVENSRTAKVFQKIVDNAPHAYQYNTDGNFTYMDVIFPLHHKRNSTDKKDTCRIESVNADLRSYIAGDSVGDAVAFFVHLKPLVL